MKLKPHRKLQIYSTHHRIRKPSNYNKGLYFFSYLHRSNFRASGEGQNASYDKEMIKRLDEVENLPTQEKQRIIDYMDLIIRDYKTKAAYS